MRLAPNPLLPAEIALESARLAQIAVTGGGAAPFAINGQSFTDWGPKPVVALPRGAPTVFAIANKTAVVQALRLGGHVAEFSTRWTTAGSPTGATPILIQPGRKISIAFVADNPGKWPIESPSPNIERPASDDGFRWGESQRRLRRTRRRLASRSVKTVDFCSTVNRLVFERTIM